MLEIIIDENIEADFTLPEGIEQAVLAACDVAGFPHVEPELCIRFASDDAVQALNSAWRQKPCVTDVLSFPMQEGEVQFSQPLGDIALAVPFVLQEAARLERHPSAHQLHLVIHAVLHLLGYDHINDDDALKMQALEQRAMAALGLHDPYSEGA